MKLAYPVPVPPYRMTDSFGARKSFNAGGIKTGAMHGGQDFAPPVPNQKGTACYASALGRVVAIRHKGVDRNVWGNRAIYNIAAGNLVIVEYLAPANDPFIINSVRHTRIWVGYNHLETDRVDVNQWVAANAIVGILGATGAAKGVHLHADVFIDSPSLGSYAFDRRVNPMTIFSREKAVGTSPQAPTAPNTPSPAPAPAPTPPVKTPEQILEEELLSAEDNIVNRLVEHIDQQSQSRTRADTRGFIHLEVGDGSIPVEQARHAVYIGEDGIRVLHPPAKYGMGEIASIRGGTGANATDYRWVDQERWASPLIEQRFWNRVKDSLIARNYFGDDRNVKVEDAKAWVAKWEKIKRDEAIAAGQSYSA